MANTLAPICVVDDDPSIREAVGGLIRSAGWKARTFKSARDFLARRRPEASCLVLDVDLPGLSGLDLQKQLVKEDAQIPIIFLTGRGDIPMSVRAIKTGALEFLTKPFDDEKLLTAIRQAIAQWPMRQARGPHRQKQNSAGIIGASAPLKAVLDQIEKVGPTELTVLIMGETGTGKELAARAIHNRSKRRCRAFVSVNCAAIPSGLIASELFGHEKGAFTGALQRRVGRFELAEGGTIFLDKVGDLPAEAQALLLRVLQEKEFERIGGNETIVADVRVIAATKRDLQLETAAGTFRGDLFYQLNVFPIGLPPLRERKEDIPALVDFFIRRHAQKTGEEIRQINDKSLEDLQGYSWPGNIRELQNVIERSLLVCDTEEFSVPKACLAGIVETKTRLSHTGSVDRASVMNAEPGIAAGVCARCGRSITHPGPDGECMRCLVSFGFLSDEQQAEGAESDQPVKPGPLRYAHFEVEINADGYPKILGSGAMAITYCARDTILDSTVALKVITRKLAENVTARARFLREARAAAQIQHPNVARVIHYGEQDGECFYAMELVRGETLEERVQRDGALPVSLALQVVEQTARGLAAGEACGVIHRDLKPSNLMTESDPSGQMLVKIIDYGVAKVMVSDPALQTQAGFIGTPGFASPEQFNELGQQQVDTRSDIYSLGIVLWYLFTGQTPFAGQSLQQVRAKQEQQLPVEQLKSRQVPGRVTALIKSMLALDPAERPQTARELLSLLHGCYLRFEPRARARRRRWLIGVAAATLVALAAAIGTWAYQRARAAETIERSIAVLPLENLTPGEENAFFTIGMQNELTAQLAHLAGMKVIGAQSTRSYTPGAPRDLVAIGRELSVRHLLEGNVWRANDQMRISLRLVDLRQPDKPWNVSYERPVKGVFTLQSEIARAIAAQLQAPISPLETAALDIPPTNDLQAYDFYLRAIAIPGLVSSPAENVAMYQRKIALLDQAVAGDPKFVLAYCELAQAHDRLYSAKVGTSLGDDTIDHRALSEAALAKAIRIAPDAGRVHLAQAQHFFSANGDAEQARIEIDLARKTLPNDGPLEQLAGSIARGRGHWEDAVRHYQRAVTLEPRDTVTRFTLASTYSLLRRYDDFDREMGTVIGFMPKKASSTFRLYRAFAPWEARGELTPLRIALSTIDNEDDPEGRIRDIFGMFLAMADHDPDAMSRILAHAADATFVYSRVKYPKGWYEGLAARMRGDNTAARIAFGVARGEVEKATLANPGEGRPLSLLAMIDAGLEQGEQAIAEARRAVELAPFEKASIDAPFVRCNLAVVYAWTGQPDLAIAELNSLVGKPAGINLPAQPTYGDLKLNPVWDPLRSHPGFPGLMQKFAQPAGK